MKALLITVLVTASVLFSNCTKNNATNNVSDISNQLTASTWSIHYLLYNADQTAMFSGYIFTFKNDSSLTLANTTTSYNGKWYVQKQGDESVQLNINVTAPSQIQALNNNWKIVNNDGALIVMQDYILPATKEFHLFRR
jgi:hypothetical protein